ncbi:hypothetical protein H5410_056898 [Solanum commersonii]|uniref:Uncharacterized protein n=1 Tax=Solanum commersonii TaxID=4109 RepID=A0A9J5WNK9_SOLCO|nr:hypothetical protein H5410_056898 [Solanum commersonii]
MKPRPEKVKRITLSDWKIIGYMAIHFMEILRLKSDDCIRRSKIGAKKKIARFEPPVRLTFKIRHIAKHMIVATLPTAGIQAPSAAILLIVKDGTAEALRCCMNLNLGGTILELL